MTLFVRTSEVALLSLVAVTVGVLSGCGSSTSSAGAAASTSVSSSASPAPSENPSDSGSASSVAVPASAPKGCATIVADLLPLGALLSENTTLTPDRASRFTQQAATLRADASTGTPELDTAATAFADQVDTLIAHVQAGENQQGLLVLGQLTQTGKSISDICGVEL